MKLLHIHTICVKQNQEGVNYRCTIARKVQQHSEQTTTFGESGVVEISWETHNVSVWCASTRVCGSDVIALLFKYLQQY
jgi:hypothetical protein